MFDWQSLSFRSSGELSAIQNKLWRQMVRHILPYQPFFQEQVAKHKLDLSEVERSLASMPFSSKSDLLPTEDNPGRVRDFILQPNEESVRKYMAKTTLVNALLNGGKDNLKKELQNEFKPLHIHFTTGRSTAQIAFFYSQYDLDRLAETGRRLVQTIGASPDEIVVNAFPYAPHLAFWQAYMASTASGLLALQSGGGKILTTVKIMDSIERMRATLLIVMPGYGYHLLREAVAQKRNFSSLKFIVMGGERVNRGLRTKMKEMLIELGAKNVKILSTYAFTEGKTAWVQCHEKSGYHLYPDLEKIELVDNDGNLIEPGEAGEVVYTALGWRGSVVTRYRTGDICQGINYEACQYCGRTVPRLDLDIERKSENVDLLLTKVKGELVNLNTFHSLIHENEAVDEWQVEIGKKNNDPNDLDILTLHIAVRPKYKPEKVVVELQRRVQSEMGVSPIVTLHDRDEMVELLGLETNLKEKRIIDHRN